MRSKCWNAPSLLSALASAGVWAAAGIAAAGAQDLAPKPPPGLRTSPEVLETLAEEIEAYRVENEVPSVAVALVHEGEIIFEKGFGLARLAEKVPTTAHTQYGIGSVSKALTVAGLMRLVEQGRIDLDRPVNDYLGDTPLRSVVGDPDEITVRQVAMHTGGLMRYVHFVNDKDPLGVPSRSDQIVRYGVAMSPPGKRHIYSNLGYGVLARLIEVQSGLKFEEFMWREIFEPLGMTRTTMGPNPASEAAIMYGGQDEYFGGLVPEEPGQPLADMTPLALAAGHYYSTVHDLARFAIFNMKYPLAGARPPLSHASIDELHTPNFYRGKYYAQAIAWQTIEDDGGVLTIGHQGGGFGMRAHLLLFPQDDLAMAFLMNDTRPSAVLGFRKIIFETLKTGLYNYWSSLWDVPLEGDAEDDAGDSPQQELSDAEKTARWLETARALAGQWDAEIGGPLESHPMTLTIRETGEVFVDFDDNGLPSVLTRADLSPSGIGGTSLGHVNADYPWRNAPHTVRLDLKITDDRIRGQMEFGSYADLDATSVYSFYSMIHWAEFERRTEDPASNK